jgi:hypothetical protein
MAGGWLSSYLILRDEDIRPRGFRWEWMMAQSEMQNLLRHVKVLFTIIGRVEFFFQLGYVVANLEKLIFYLYQAYLKLRHNLLYSKTL